MSAAPVIDVRENLRLLGTAHIATSSVEAVRQQISEYKPDIVAVELCQSRHDTLVSDRRLDKEGLLKVMKEGKAPMVLLSPCSRLSNENSVSTRASNPEPNCLQRSKPQTKWAVK